MQVLNLIDSSKSSIKYDLFTFNDGESHIKLYNIDRKDIVVVICRIANPNDLFILLQVGDILNRQEVPFSLHITYLMSMRMDRVMSFDESFSLKIVANAINSIKPFSVSILEPHSFKSIRLINKSHKTVPVLTSYIDINKHIIVLPDAGAMERYPYLNTVYISANKVRDTNTGYITSMTLSEGAEEVVKNNPNKTLFVVDDLCDSGATFQKLATLLAEKFPDRERKIGVTHMVNPKGIKVLSDCYDEVYFTNSYKDWDKEILPNNTHVINCLAHYESH